MNKSHLTAINRGCLPAPTQWLWWSNLILGNVLDFGCGKSHEANLFVFPCDGYDPYYRPAGITRKEYDTILCIYVLNVIQDKKERDDVLSHIASLLSNTGRAYVTVRNDIAKDHVTKRGTWQGKIVLPYTKTQRTPSYTTYSFSKEEYARIRS